MTRVSSGVGSRGRDFAGGAEVGVLDVAGVGAAAEIAGEAGSRESNAAGESGPSVMASERGERGRG
jgi:hypothetical protein